MSKICTDLEQSKKLTKLLPLESADMVYIKHSTSNNPDWRFNDNIPPMILGKTSIKDMTVEVLPCWSLGTLLELMPSSLVLENTLCLLYVKKYPQRYEIYYADNGFVPKGIIESDTLIEAAFNMVVWLLENKHIK